MNFTEILNDYLIADRERNTALFYKVEIGEDNGPIFLSHN